MLIKKKKSRLIKQLRECLHNVMDILFNFSFLLSNQTESWGLGCIVRI